MVEAVAGKLAKCAGLVRNLRSKHSTHEAIEAADQEGASAVSTVLVKKEKVKEKVNDTRRGNIQRVKQGVWHKARAGAGVLRPGKRKRAGAGVMGHTAIEIHEDDQSVEDYQGQSKTRKMSAQAALIDDDASSQATESEDEVDESVVDDMRKLEENFAGISQKYRLINRIGEGTFSTVYKAEQLPQHDYDTEIENEEVDDLTGDAPPTKRRKTGTSTNGITRRRRPQFVALKKIYVTSSPHRILNELELLHELRDHDKHICPLLTAFRHLDQVVAVLPYFRHLDFRLYYREFIVNDMRSYFQSLFSGLAWVHKAGILHRDIKPTNFLYDHTKKQGVLVDFGLAERQGTDFIPCLCTESKDKQKLRFKNSSAVEALTNGEDHQMKGVPKNDTRPSRRANRAGTRGFRAPEVLLKCTSQTTKIDIWSAGVILLTILARRFPFFNSADDVDAMIEIASIFGKRKMQSVAALHGQIFETSIDTIGVGGFAFEKIIIWASCRDPGALHPGEAQAVSFLKTLLELDPGKRVSAKEALNHEFFKAPVEDEFERTEREEKEAEEGEARGLRC